MLLKTSRWLLCLTALCTAPTAAQAQMFFEADWVALQLDDGSSAQYIAGPDAFSADGQNDFEPGYRITLGGAIGEYEVYAMFTGVDQWRDSGSLTLVEAVALDLDGGQAFLPAFNTLAFPNLLFDAASHSNADPTLDETLETELLQAGSTARYSTRTDYRDFEITGGTGRYSHPWRVGIGYRHIRLNGSNDFAISGTFDAIDSDDGAVFGDATNDLNDGLVENAFLAAGFTAVSAGSFDAFNTANGPDIMTIVSSSQAHNELNGAQATFAYRAFEGSWVTFEGLGKLGLYHNKIGGGVTETVAGDGNSSAIYRRAFLNEKTTAAFVGTLGFRLIGSLTDYINLTAGYDAQFLTGVAAAGDQTQGVQRDLLGNLVYDIALGDLIIHGVNVGLELNW